MEGNYEILSAIISFKWGTSYDLFCKLWNHKIVYGNIFYVRTNFSFSIPLGGK